MDFDDSSSLSSALSSAPPSDDERLKLAPIFLKAMGKSKKPTVKISKKPKQPEPPASPPRPPRSPSPPHDDTLADNPDIAFLVMFRSRFAEAFPPKLAHLGPQDIERGIDGPSISPQVENLLCALLGIVLNRKKAPESGHYGRALEEALASQKAQWPRSWGGQNPLPGSKTFNSLAPSERLNLLRTLVMWSLSSSEVVSQMIKDSYKQSRHEDDMNQPLSVQPWGLDGDKRRYWLVEGQDDTSFRLYRENAKFQEPVWWSMAGSIDEINAIAERLNTKDTTQAARRLAGKISAAIPRFEATEEKRRRREYRQIRRAQFARPEPGFSLYEGRTRGKRLRYTFDDDDEFEELTDGSVRRSGRHSDRSTPAEIGPVITASGRQVRQREGGMYGESLLTGQSTAADSPASEELDEIHVSSRGRRTAARGGVESRKRNFSEIYNSDQSDEDEAASDGGWNSADNEDEGDDENDEDEADYSDLDADEEEPSLVVKLKVPGLARLEDEIVLATNGSSNETVKPEPGPKPATNGTNHVNGVGADVKMEDAEEAPKAEEPQPLVRDAKSPVKDDSGIAEGDIHMSGALQGSVEAGLPHPAMHAHPLVPVDS